MNKGTIISLVLFCGLLTGCEDKIYDVSYYKEHQDEAQKISDKCKAGEITNNNCKNANEALYDIKRKEIINQMLGQSYKEKEEHKKKVNELMERLQ
ncbi:EexN family lipoprotein [Escherichia coli]|uniref:EexN family lipoprotein n=1 Tax=Escherichia TaxID=561 RepID=UPI001C8C17D6|nr:EexN family lipoprotein [Escherichia coli]MBX8823410.1 EexN family lipoprotein [Escherichia coli]MBX8842489.1 EexN family lipoprotein [Escherichia coli]HDQ1643801.1 EexN family lipoprotein [Escherichia coli]